MRQAQPPCPETPPFAIRDYLPSDFDLLLKIDAECFAPGIRYAREELAGFIDQSGAHTWVAEREGDVAGFLVAARIQTRRLHIVTLDVRERWRRCGVGRALMLAAENLAAGEERTLISLETAEDNLPAQSFYQKLGFQKVRRINSYYSDGSAAWLMVKSLARGASGLSN